MAFYLGEGSLHFPVLRALYPCITPLPCPLGTTQLRLQGGLKCVLGLRRLSAFCWQGLKYTSKSPGTSDSPKVTQKTTDSEKSKSLSATQSGKEDTYFGLPGKDKISVPALRVAWGLSQQIECKLSTSEWHLSSPLFPRRAAPQKLPPQPSPEPADLSPG